MEGEELSQSEHESAAAVADRPDGAETATPPSGDKKRKGKRKKDEGDDLEYEVEFATPFGKLEFEFEPLAKKERKDRERKAKAERDAAKKALKVAEKTAPHGGGSFISKLVIVLLVLGLIGAAIAAAYWLFARPGESDEDAIPPEFANEPQPEPAAQGLLAKTRTRVSAAISAGRQASREAQREQREKFDQMTGR